MKAFLTARWTDLAVITYEVDKKLLEKFLPYKTELNPWNGKYLMSMVGFMFSAPSLLGVKSPFFRTFEEVNLRFYVRYKSGNAWKSGVVFIKEIVRSKCIGLTAKLLYHENFIALPTKHTIEVISDKRLVEYKWKINNSWNYLKLKTGNHPILLESNSIESFISNVYHAYTKLSNYKTLGFKVAHVPWKVYKANDFNLKLDAEAIYGKEFVEYFKQKPFAACLMDGSFTEVSHPGLI